MRAAVLLAGRVSVEDVADPVRSGRLVLVRTNVSGICGSDLSVIDHGDEVDSLRREAAQRAPHSPIRAVSVDPAAAFVLGHEFSAEVIDPGPERPDLSPGDIVVAIPRLFDADGAKHTIGFSAAFPGGFGEMMLLDPDFVLKVPDGADPLAAALTEPFAVARHAVNATRQHGAAIVVGCGPVGLAIISCLVADGWGPIVASDLSETRRALALQFGAEIAVDPRHETPVAAWHRTIGGETPVVFEAVGKPGVLDDVLMDSVANTEIVVVGAMMGADQIRPMLALGRELTLRFVLGYSDDEFAATLADISSGRLNAAALIHEVIALEDLPKALPTIRSSPGKVLVAPPGR
ncbi:L-idonate 5-dehydrogenase [bacterium BMS3Bbin02]|nr:L-idonate 5-dehydrogenase [bacterium BMS3Bbin02]